MIAAVDIERVARYQPRGVMGEECGGKPNVHDAHKGACGRLLLGLVEEFIEFRDAGSGARCKRPRRNGVNADALGADFGTRCIAQHFRARPWQRP